MSHSDCLFCRIVAGEIPSTQVHNDAEVVAFRDIEPRAPVHVLLIPRQHVRSAAELGEDSGPFLGHLLAVANEIAEREGIAESGWRLVTNVGPDSGFTVPHLHFHLMGGRQFTWPPG